MEISGNSYGLSSPPPVAGLVHFVGIAGKAIASYAFTTEETGVEALLSEGSVKAL